MRKESRGFTLVELLVTFSIISILATIILTSMKGAQAQTRDARAKADMRSVQSALSLYFDKYGMYPNYGANVTTNAWKDNFISMAQQLVAEGFLGQVPVPPANHTYQYYNYGVGSTGGLLVTYLESGPTSTGYPGTCRPWGPNLNWCSQAASREYCLCNADL